MNKIILFFFIIAGVVLAQPFTIDNLHLSDISSIIKFEGITDSSAQTLTLLDEKGSIIKAYSLDEIKNNNNKIVFAETGDFILRYEKYSVSIRVIPGVLSLLPPLAAILLALIFRQVVIALVSGIYLGSLFIYDYNPLLAFLHVGDEFVLKSTADESHILIILFTLLIGGVVGVITKNGGTHGLALKITRYANTPRSGMLSSWLLGMAIFFDDYANSLIMGNMMRPITDKLKISRAKLAYIVDSTSAPIASLMIISTWIGYELGLIDSGLKSIGYEVSAYSVFIDSIPYRFYPIAALFMVFVIAYSKRDFGPMLKSERYAREHGIQEEDEISEEKSDYKNAKWYNGAVPILIILFGTIGGLIYTGISSLNQSGITGYGLQEIISNSDSYRALLWASFFAGIAAVLMSVFQKILTLHDALEAWQKGLQSMLYACVILVFAWGISMITTELKTADYIISLVSDSFDPRFLPAIVFIICGVISFSTGTSWGTMAIVMPLVIPLAYAIAQNNGISDPYLIITGSVSSVLAGSVFGDHCSPIADTTILSSMASRCNHIEHVRTQLPYSVVAGVVAVLLGELPSAFGLNPYLSILLICVTLVMIVRFYGKKNEPAEY